MRISFDRTEKRFYVKRSTALSSLFFQYIYAHSLIFGSFAFIFILGVVFTIIKPTLADVAVFYPTSCLGGWEYPENAQGAPSLSPDAKPEEYSVSNSARLKGSTATLYCGGWKGTIPENTKPKLFTFSLSWSVDDGTVVHSEPQPFNVSASPTQTPTPDVIQIMDGSTPSSNSSSTPTPEATPNNTSDVPVQSPASAPTPAADVQSFLDTLFGTKVFAEDAPDTTTSAVPSVVPDSASSDQSSTTATPPASSADTPSTDTTDVTTSAVSSTPSVVSDSASSDQSSTTATPPASSADTPSTDTTDVTTSAVSSTDTKQLNPLVKVQYTLDGTTWQTLGTVDMSNWKNASFAVALPGWDTLDHFQVSVTPVTTFDAAPTIYIDSMQMTVSYDDIGNQIFPPTVKLDDAHNGISGKDNFKSNDPVEFDITSPNLDIGEIKTLVNQGNAEVVRDQNNILGTKPDPLSTVSTLPEVVTDVQKTLLPTTDSLLPTLPIPVLPQDTSSSVAPTTKSDDTTSQPTSFFKWLFTPTPVFAEDTDITAVVKTFYGDDTDIAAHVVTVLVDGQEKKKVQIDKPSRSFKPGKYKLEVTFTTPAAVFVSEQDFNWGVLSINTNKSVFAPGDSAYLQMGVLNDAGHTLCNAGLDLTVTSPTGGATAFSTSDGSIIRDPQCGPDNVISVPDYYAHYLVPSSVGVYQMNLTAHTANGDKTITDSFTVSNDTSFSIERVGPTRIYPVATYPMTLHVISATNWQGTVTEQVPASFTITQPQYSAQYDALSTNGDTQTISWNVSLVAGQDTVLGYQFLAPPESPQFYLAGTASLVSSGGASVFTESRNWQIASDAACNATTTGTWGTGTDTASFTSCTGAATTGTGTGNRPGPADALTINAGVTLTVTSNQSVGSIAIASPTTANGLSINTGVTLTVTTASGGTGAVTYTANATANAQTITLNGTGGITAVSLTIPAPTSTGASLVTCAASATGTFSTSGAISITGNSTSTGAVTLGMSTCTLAATGLTTITGGSNATGVPTISSSTGTLTFSGGLTFAGTVANAKLTTSGAGTINLSGTISGAATPSINAATTLVTTGTTVIGGAYTFGKLNVSSGTTTLNSFAITFAGTSSISGTLTNASGATLKTFTGLVTVNTGGSFLMNVVTNPTLSFGGGIAMNGTSFNSGTGTTTLTATQTFSGTSAMTIGAAISIPTGTTLTLSNTSLTFSSTITMPIGSPNLIIATGANVSTTGLTFTANSTAGGAQLVTLQGTGNFSPAAITMPATTSTGTAKITAATGATGTLSVSGAVSITGSATASGGLSSIDFGTTTTAVNFTTGALTATAGTVSGAQIIMGTGTLTTNGLMTLAAAASGTAPASFSTTTGLVNIKAGLTFSGTVIANASFTTGATTITLTGTMTGAGTLSIAGATFNTTGTAALNAAYTLPNLTVITGTTTMNSFAISINGTTTIQNGGILTNATGATLKTFVGLVNVQSGGSFNLNVATACTVEFRGGIQVDSGATSFVTTGATSFTTNNQSISGTGTIGVSFGATTITTPTITLTQSYTGNTVTFATLTLVSPTAAYGLSLSTGTTTTSTGLISFPANVTTGAFTEAVTLNGTANLNAGSVTMTAPTTTVAGAKEGIIAASGASGTVTVTGATAITGGATGTQFAGIDLSAGTGAFSGAAVTITGGATGVAGLILGTGNLTLTGTLTGGGTTANSQLTTGADTILLNGATLAATTTTLSIASATLNAQGSVLVSGAYTFPNLNVLSGTTSLGGVAITITGATNVTGTLASVSATATKAFNGPVTVNSGGSFDLSAFATITSFASDVTASTGAVKFNSGTGAVTFNGTTQSLGGTVNMSFGGGVTINSGSVVTNNNTATVTMGTLTLNAPTVANGLSLSTGSTTTVTGAIAYAANNTANNETITMNGTANLNAASLTVIAPTSTGSELLTCAGGATGTFATTGAMTITGNSTSTGQSTLAMGTCTLRSGGLLTIAGGTNATGVSTVSSSTGSLNFPASATFGGTAANARLTTTGAGTINLTGTFDGAGVASINASTTLVTTGTTAINGTYTFGNLSVPSGTLSLGGFAITFAGTTSVTGGSIATTSATGLKTFTGAVTVTSGSFDLSAFATATSFGGGITMNGTTFNTGTGATTFTASQSLAGASNMTFGGATTINNTFTVTNSNTATVTFSNNLLGGGSSANFATYVNSTTNCAGSVMTTGTLTPSTSVNTVAYTGGTQSIKVPVTNPYYNLTIGAAGTKSLSSATSVSGTTAINAGTLDTVSGSNYALTTGSISIGASGTMLGQGATITVTGNWTNSGVFTSGTSTVLMNGGNTATVSGTTTFNNLTITHSAAKQVNFQTSGTPIFHVTGVFTVTGHSGALMTLRSDATPTQWQLHPTGTASINYADVMDGGCQAGSIAMSPTNFTNSGNNGSCWSAPSITFSISDNTIGFGSLTTANACYATSDTLGSSTDVSAHNIQISTNAPGGYVLSYNGSLPTSGSSTIPAASITNSATGSPGTVAAFGMSFDTNGSSTINSLYTHSATPSLRNWAFVPNTTTSIVTNTSPVASPETINAYYIANITGATPAGNYITNITYIATGTF